MALKQDSVDFVVCPKHGNKIEDIAILLNIGRVPSPYAHTLLQGEGQLGILTLNKNKTRQCPSIWSICWCFKNSNSSKKLNGVIYQGILAYLLTVHITDHARRPCSLPGNYTLYFFSQNSAINLDGEP